MFEKLKHSMYCGITLDNTKIIQEDYSIFNYMIVECMECGKQYFVFRINGQAQLEKFNESNIEILNNRIEYLKKYFELKEYLENKDIIINSENIDRIIDYPLGVEEIKINVYSKTDGILYENITLNEYISLIS